MDVAVLRECGSVGRWSVLSAAGEAGQVFAGAPTPACRCLDVGCFFPAA